MLALSNELTEGKAAMRPLILWSLNGERFAGETETSESQTMSWFKSLSQEGLAVPDILCLQDFRVSILQYLNSLPYFSFVPMTRHPFWGCRELLGLCVASKWPISDGGDSSHLGRWHGSRPSWGRRRS
jgi:hypothetical protein